MELLALILVLWLIGCLFPGSGQSYGYSFREVCAFIACALLLVAMFFAYWFIVAGLLYAGEWMGLRGSAGWLLFALLSPIAIPMIVAGTVNGIAEQRRVS